jgi:hypothetical protein
MKMLPVVSHASWRVKVAILVAAVGLAGVGVVVTVSVGGAETTPLAGVPVPSDLMPSIREAAKSCPALSPARVAGQLMEASRFSTDANTERGGQGMAGLTDVAWATWAPWKGAKRSDARASILGLAHYVCDLIGQVRVAGVAGDPWRLGLAAYVAGVTAIPAGGTLPAAVQAYVDTVEGYAAWYEVQFAGSRAAAASLAPIAGGAPTISADPIPVPDAYLPSVVVAGKVCDVVTPVRIAAQLMAMSGFDADRVGATGAQGIAQFPPNLWAQYGPPNATPRDPAVAIPALGRAMCDLARQMSIFLSDPYLLALAAYQWGTDAVRQVGGNTAMLPSQSFIQRVMVYADYYRLDNRLAATSSATQRALPTTGPALPTHAAPRPPVPPPPSPGRALVGRGSGKCLSSTRASDGTQLQIWSCDGSMPQQWTFEADGTIRSVGLCMDAADAGTADGTRVQVAVCSGNPAQQFRLQANGDLLSIYANRCVDVFQQAVADGSLVVLWHCVGLTNQKWTLT